MSHLKQTIFKQYADWAPRSAERFLAAQEVFPGGDTRMSAHYAPFPVFVERAAGARLVDADGHQILDFMNNFTSLLFGHANPAIVEAVQAQVAAGSAYAAPTESQVSLARLLRNRVPSIEKLRFTSSGSEATLMAIRCARAATGRDKIMKMEGGYHGSYELAEVSLAPRPDRCGPLDTPNALPVDDSFPDSVLRDTVVCPYNEPEIAERLIARHAKALAAVIVEPVLGSMGMIPASAEFLATLRDATEQHGIVLIFDEVITLRLAMGGAQDTLGIVPDLTAMGKVIGGGLPIGAIGGADRYMQMFDPSRKRPVLHASTFSGNPLSMAAGLAAMTQVSCHTLEHVNKLGDRFRDGVNSVFVDAGIRGQASGTGSLCQIHLSDAPLRSARDTIAGNISAGELTSILHLAMLQRGVFSASRMMYCMSVPMTEDDVDFAIDAFSDVLRSLRPQIAKEWPQVILA
jgi:glutamate-1-semialdehyde 2,1-aminomutase